MKILHSTLIHNWKYKKQNENFLYVTSNKRTFAEFHFQSKTPREMRYSKKKKNKEKRKDTHRHVLNKIRFKECFIGSRWEAASGKIENIFELPMSVPHLMPSTLSITYICFEWLSNNFVGMSIVDDLQDLKRFTRNESIQSHCRFY